MMLTTGEKSNGPFIKEYDGGVVCSYRYILPVDPQIPVFVPSDPKAELTLSYAPIVCNFIPGHHFNAEVREDIKTFGGARI